MCVAVPLEATFAKVVGVVRAHYASKWFLADGATLGSAVCAGVAQAALFGTTGVGCIVILAYGAVIG